MAIDWLGGNTVRGGNPLGVVFVVDVAGAIVNVRSCASPGKTQPQINGSKDTAQPSCHAQPERRLKIRYQLLLINIFNEL